MAICGSSASACTPPRPGTGGRKCIASITWDGIWQINDLESNDVPYGIAPLPAIFDEQAQWANSHHFFISRQGAEDENKAAAAQVFIAWMSEHSADWAGSAMIPARESVRTSAELTTVAPVMANFAEEAEYAVLLPSVPGIGSAIRAEGYVRAVNAVLLSQQTDVKAALDQAAQRSNELLEQNRRTYGGSQ